MVVVKEHNKEKESLGQRMKTDAKNCLKDIKKKDILILILCAIGVNFVIETLALIKYDGLFGAVLKLLPDFGNTSNRVNDAFAGFMGIFTNPVKVFNDPIIFLYNSAIVMVVLSLAFLAKKRYFAMTVLSTLWIIFGVANFVVLSYRVTPFSFVDLKLIDAAVGVMKSYVTGPAFIIVAVVVLGVVASLVFVWIKTPKLEKVNRFSGLVVVACTFFVVFGGLFAGQKTGVLASNLPNLSVNYQEYGFVYCFVSSFKTGIGKPSGYSADKVSEVTQNTEEKLHDKHATSDDKEVSKNDDNKEIQTPNVIFLQLESFFDITAVEGLELSEDPIPTFRKCVEEYSSGFLSVPSIGAGTANTEFEIMTGLNLDFFGPGEYPYKTVLKDKTCETTGFNLKNHGYTAHAIHNNRATFYGRNAVFRRFGFDVFTSVELMNVRAYTENGWAKDAVLTEEIMKCLNYSEGQDYIYTISVQGHGEYPDSVPLEKPEITVDGGVEDANKYRVQYYVNQIKEMDIFLADLIEELEAYGEDTVLVVYGDHLPNLDFTDEMLTKGNMFQTQYFVWNNIGLDVVKEDVEAYQLSAKILNSIGIEDGVINAYHQANWDIRDTQEYQDNLEILGYDMLYGDNYATGGQNPYEPTKLQYGVEMVEVTDAYRDQSDTGYLIVKGDNFTEYSVVYVGNEKVPSKLLDENTLKVNLGKQVQDVQIQVRQSYKGKLVLQKSNELTYYCINDQNIYDDGDDMEEVDEEMTQEEDDIAGLLEESSAIMDDEIIDDEIVGEDEVQ